MERMNSVLRAMGSHRRLLRERGKGQSILQADATKGGLGGYCKRPCTGRMTLVELGSSDREAAGVGRKVRKLTAGLRNISLRERGRSRGPLRTGADVPRLTQDASRL